ncbi:hypothetical protein [Kitasatospora acidiphila]|uniref:hypothetical protein n=1 Tax=Kitasatospora acidiphila TaxID=2567942 RepID=UPI003C706C48
MYPNPARFDPGRRDDDMPSPSDSAYIPFGTGPPQMYRRHLRNGRSRTRGRHYRGRLEPAAHLPGRSPPCTRRHIRPAQLAHAGLVPGLSTPATRRRDASNDV